MEAKRLECEIPEDRQYHCIENNRQRWRTMRAALETDSLRKKRMGVRRRTFLDMVDALCRTTDLFLRVFRLYGRGYRNAEKKVMKTIDLHFPNLPVSFKSYRILHLTDFHFDCMAGTEKLISRKIKDLEFDLCVFTGDYRGAVKGRFEQIAPPLKEIVSAVNAKDGIFATLGNHDTYRMEGLFEELGVTILANETATICRGNETISVTGLDDPHYYCTDQAFEALAEPVNGFKIVLAHTPELYDVAAQHDYRLYLCGHTHGGQISLPGGIPVITHLNRGRRYNRGLWQYDDMKGYTNQGCGVVRLPIRFNTQSEIAVITLHNGTPPY